MMRRPYHYKPQKNTSLVQKPNKLLMAAAAVTVLSCIIPNPLVRRGMRSSGRWLFASWGGRELASSGNLGRKGLGLSTLFMAKNRRWAR
jgi:hypothetical protein